MNNEQTKLWAVHFTGPDDLYPAPSKEVAELYVKWAKRKFRPETLAKTDVKVVEWPWPAGHDGGKKTLDMWQWVQDLEDAHQKNG